MFRNAVVGMLLVGTGCATMFSGSKQVVFVDSSPSGAEVKVHIGSTKFGNRRDTVLERGTLLVTEKTPASIELPRMNDYILVFDMPDRPEVVHPLCKTVAGNPWILLNLLNLNIGMLVDRFSTGASETLETNAFALIPREPEVSVTPLICRPSSS